VPSQAHSDGIGSDLESLTRQLGVLGELVLCVLVGLALAAGADAQAVGGEGPQRASFGYSEDPERLVFRYSERPGALGGPDAERSISVYGDGRVVAHRPRFTKRAGSWGTHLSREEMEELVRSLVEPGLVEFDETRARQSRKDLKRQRRLQRGELFEVSDADTVTLELHLDRYRGRESGAQERRNVVKRVRWRGLRSDLRRYPELTDLEGLGAVQGRIHALMERPDLSRLDSAGQP
jgi:hypothetical protein